MPELPEVEVCRRSIAPITVGHTVVAAEHTGARQLVGDPTLLVGHTVTGWVRHGKYLTTTFTGPAALVSHFGMTGKWVTGELSPRPHTRLRLRLASGGATLTLDLVDPRGFGGAWVLPASALATHPRLACLGPDALTAPPTASVLAARVGAGRSPLKQRLLDQSVIAGLGNIAVVDVCWRARIHPHTPCGAVPKAVWPRLSDAIAAHLEHVLAAEAGPEVVYLGERKDAPNPFVCYARAGAPCPRCRTPFQRTALAGRPTFWCPRCQPER